ncbi:rhodanese-like domain-containing protein [Roseovarius nanhaiticus]|uniref:Rhodanese-related sulfurtransferase n=1 Tax=Roseovarius nanhaiticus TaxID=573024 RepID=A0A1N7H4Y2_9RHOB|nr:rhodanese-like domain-containing protein [Roseovarius nanhaiticus]SEL12683.1 Rhodanese-related sulfurtransferase [Roseovarius nanhaiticus]SIS19914.1 Rhodanese-related sulfurtransferase [Roseovarius nanhaiticus]
MKTEQTDAGPVDLWTPEEIAADRDSLVLIDVRSPQEFALERIEGALLMPLQEFRPERLPGQQGKRLVLHCGSGVRSGKAAQMCLEAGLDPIAHMEGGMAAWKESGQPYIGTEMSTGAPKEMRKEG